LEQKVELDAEVIRRLDQAGPCYTSYPTADRFVEAFGAEAYRTWAQKRNIGGILRPLSLYVHIPFCRSICFCCGCNKVFTRNRRKAGRYIKALKQELAIQGELFRDDPKVLQLHWGGGTPTFLDSRQMRELMGAIQAHFQLLPAGEYSIEIDPRAANEDTIALLAELGFNRASLGAQDFDPVVQKAVNRIQSEEKTLNVLRAARREGFKSINIDLIYGLPYQSVAGFDRTLSKVIAMAPDRLSIYNYAHLPHVFKPQRRIDEAHLPDAPSKLQLLRLAIERVTAAGYIYIGMHHFARPEDELAVAQRQGRLHRNFQGYSTHAGCDLVALGVSAIGTMGPSYSQNFRSLDDYYGSIEQDVLPIMRGIELTADDLARRAVIQALMCQFELSKEAIEIAHLIEFDRYFATELEELRAFESDGLLTLEDRWINVTAKGRLLVRNICMVFDKYLRADRKRRMYSKVI
jgi:oxygen-independent coproporphyrinogen III oxidase